MALFGAADLRGYLEFRGKPLHELAAIWSGKWIRVRRWHFTVVDYAEDFDPPFHVGSALQIWVERVESNVAFLGFRAVAIDTRTFKNRLDGSAKFGQVRLGGLRRTRWQTLCYVVRPLGTADFKFVQCRNRGIVAVRLCMDESGRQNCRK